MFFPRGGGPVYAIPYVFSCDPVFVQSHDHRGRLGLDVSWLLERVACDNAVTFQPRHRSIVAILLNIQRVYFATGSILRRLDFDRPPEFCPYAYRPYAVGPQVTLVILICC